MPSLGVLVPRGLCRLSIKDVGRKVLQNERPKYNIRGFGQQGCRTQLRDYSRSCRLDFIGLQETIKKDFTMVELRGLEWGGQFVWNWLPANGHSGGLLLGFWEDTFEVVEWKKGDFFLSTSVLHRSSKYFWCFFLVSVLADHGRSNEFVGELASAVRAAPYLVVVGGDFNLIWATGDKSNGNINWPRVRRFNDVIASLSLREICRTVARFTWTNKHLSPIRCVLDRVFISVAWDAVFPPCSLTAITRIGSDHCPLLLDSGQGIVLDKLGSSSKPGGAR
jgi:hypothetical protein